MSEVAAAGGTTVAVATFEELFDEQRQPLFSAMWLIARDRHEAEDLAQEAFVRVWERWDRTGPPDDPAGYLFRTAMNLFLNRRRRARSRPGGCSMVMNAETSCTPWRRATSSAGRCTR